MTIAILGAGGLIGRSLLPFLKGNAVISPSRSLLDLTDSLAVRHFMRIYKPKRVYFLAADVGGIDYNLKHPATIFSNNLSMIHNVFSAAMYNKVEKMVFVGSSCMYPKHAPQPFLEEFLGHGDFEPSNYSYALAKQVGVTMAKTFFDEYGLLTVCPILTNVYGLHDHFDEKAHVIPALVKKIFNAKKNSLPSITLRGTGRAKREFLFAEDAAKALKFCMETLTDPNPINVGSNFEYTIEEVAWLICDALGYTGDIVWGGEDDGMLKKKLDISKITALGFSETVNLREGLKRVVNHYLEMKV